MATKKDMNGIYPCGIYFIINKTNYRIYVGASTKIINRFHQHKSTLRDGIHKNQSLQKDWNEFGESSFEFDIFHYCKKEELSELEQYYIKLLTNNMSDRNGSYNSNLKSGYPKEKAEIIVEPIVKERSVVNEDVPLLREKDLIKLKKYMFLQG